MISRILSILVLAIVSCRRGHAETLDEVLRNHKIAEDGFTAADLGQKITSYAISQKDGDPFLLAYYIDDESGILHPPLRIVRYSRATRDLRRVDRQDTTASFTASLFSGTLPISCLASALSISERYGVIYVDTHVNPSAGCILILSQELSFKGALSGGLLAVLGADYAILQESEIHFASVHPMRIAVYDLRGNHLMEVYPPKQDSLRDQFSQALRAHMPAKEWCAQENAECNPEHFDSGLSGKVAMNERARVFGFEAQFDAGGFGAEAEAHVSRQRVDYVFQLRGAGWEHREFLPSQLKSLFGVVSLEKLISEKPQAAFGGAVDRGR